MKPVLFVTGHVPAYRVGAFGALHEQQGIEVALTGGRSLHGGPAAAGELPFPHIQLGARAVWSLARSGRHRAVVCSTAGRLAPLAAWAGARNARVPLLLWTSLWAQPSTPAHVVTYMALRRLYSHADAVVTYGPHVSAYVRARGARNVHVAPQSVDNGFWRAQDVEAPPLPGWPSAAGTRFLFVGREDPEKGLSVLLSAWRRAGGAARQSALVLVGAGHTGSERVLATGALSAEQLRDVYAAGDVLVVPSIATRTFREPWGLVVNEAMNRGLPVIASDAVGAAAGGLVRDGVNGLVFAAGDEAALAHAIERLAADPDLRARMGANGAQEVLAYSHEAWAGGFSAALSSLGLARGRW